MMYDMNEKSPLHSNVEKSFISDIKDTNNSFLNVNFENNIDENSEKIEPNWKKYLLNIDNKPSLPPTLISINETRFATEGNISVITGKAKSKKTFLNSAIAAATISDESILGFTNNGKRLKVTYFDTEQSNYDSYKVLERIYKMSNCNIKESISYFMLRELTPEERLKEIESVIIDDNFKEHQIIIIDGVRDLINNFNCPDESINLVTKLMKWSSSLNKHIITVIHQNKGNEFARGHLGTELMNKCESVINVTKEKDSYISSVSAEHMRGKEFEPFSFMINSEGIPELCDKPIMESSSKKTIEPYKFDKKMHFKVLSEIYKTNTSYTNNNLIYSLKKTWNDNNVPIGDSKCRVFITYYLSENYIINRGSDKKFDLYLSDSFLSNGLIDFKS